MKKTIFTSLILIVLLQITSCSSSAVNSSTYKEYDELVVLAHGLGRSDGSMWKLAHRLEDAGYKVCRLDYTSIGESVEAVLQQTNIQIGICIKDASKVHFVGHSLGGLVIRAYLQHNNHDLENIDIGEVVLIGTPNNGSEIADHLSGSWLMDIGGGVSRALMTGKNSLGNNLEDFDATSGVNLGVIAGTRSSILTSERFTGPNDGLVSVESTKLKSMSDFVAIDVNHSQMRYNLKVAEQTIYFLQQGVFKH